jgi:broad specificity phosphatase PhoE
VIVCLLRRGATHGPSSRLQDGALTPEMEAAAMATADKLLGLSGSGVTKSMQIVVTSFDQVSSPVRKRWN